MIKTLSSLNKAEKEKYKIPRKIQQIIPIDTIFTDGIFKVGKNKYSVTYKFTDINYAVASKEATTSDILPGVSLPFKNAT